VPDRDRPLLAVGRPGLDVQTALSPSRGPSERALRAVSVQRRAEPGPGRRPHRLEIEATSSPIASEHPARLPGLDIARVLARQHARAASLVPRAFADAQELVPATTLGPSGTRADLQLSPSPTRAEAAPVAAPGSPPVPLVALPTPPDPPATVQRITSAAGPDPTSRERLSEAPDDELEELADRLYDHISARFRAELLVDRERAGVLADVY
jgi:hypothetical protein